MFRLQLSVVRLNHSQVVRIEPFLCEGALRDRNTRELYSNNLREVGRNNAQLKTKQNRKQDKKTRHRDQNKVTE